MDALLILGACCLLLISLFWLALRAFARGAGWGLLCLLPPLTLLYLFRHGREARTPLLLAAVAALPLGIGLLGVAEQDPDRLRSLLSLEWLKPVRDPWQPDIRLRGSLWGEPFAPVEGDFIEGRLRLSQGAANLDRRELVIHLGEFSGPQLTLDILPQDAEVPTVELVRRLPGNPLPEALRLERGYSLHLQLRRQAPNRLVGDLHLGLPSAHRTWLSGPIEVFTDGLRYRAGSVDARFDSAHTLQHVIEDYLQRRFPQHRVEAVRLPDIDWHSRPLELRVQARIGNRALTLPLQLLKDEERGWRVAGDRYPPRGAPGQPADGAKPLKS